MKLIADEQILYTSPDPETIFCYTPAILIGDNNRIIVGVDLGGIGTPALDGPKSRSGDGAGNQVRLLLSDDNGKCWRESSSRLPMRHEILFRAGKSLYAMGNAPELVISRSDDNGETWSDPAVLRGDAKRSWHQSSTTPVYRNGRIYLIYEQYNPAGNWWPNIMQYLMSAPENADLCKPENWTFSEAFNGDPIAAISRALSDLKPTGTPGIFEAHLLPISPNCGHLYTEGENSFLIPCRYNSHGLQQGAILKGWENPDGTLEIGLFPGRRKEISLFNIPYPGASLKFHPLYDEVSGMYFLAANQPRSAFGGAGERANRRKLMLWCSLDAVSWQPLGTIAFGPCEKGARNYPQMAFCGEDLLIAVRSGDEHAKNEHDNNLITLHRIKNFRDLIEESGL
ncbi:MAG: exo-alpha-sialidase [Lentisphaeria bacterium]|nr:exo-alpha-sialidase [Lentisphaeria bacterium]